ncbi:MAG: aquaporin [Burkholderiales bacterium]
MTLARTVAAETLGTGLLLAVVVGSGIMGERLAGGTAALALAANAAATGACLFVLIRLFAPVSGAHFNPVVTLIAWRKGVLKGATAAAYLLAQTLGALAGVAIAHLMFGLAVFAPSVTVRSGPAQWLSELVATFGLVLTIEAAVRQRDASLALLVAAYIAAAYWFTASTAFANPAVTLARSLTPTFSGIQPVDVAGFVAAQLVGGAAAFALSQWLFSPAREIAV